MSHATRIVCSVFLFLYASAASTTLARQSSDSGDGTVRALLTDKLGFKDNAPPGGLAAYMLFVNAAAEDGSRLSDEKILALLNVLGDSPALPELTESAARAFNVTGVSSEKGPLPARYVRRSAYDQLIAYAIRAKAGDPALARRASRAALVLLASDYPVGAPMKMRTLVLDPQFRAALELDESELKELELFLNDYNDRTAIAISADPAPSVALDKLLQGFQSTGRLETADVDEMLGRLKQNWERSSEHLVSTQFFCSILWRTACTFRGAGDEAAMEKLKTLVASFEQSAKPLAKPWLGAAMSTPGPMPKSSGVRRGGPEVLKPARP
jgi:hypothetical protein